MKRIKAIAFSLCVTLAATFSLTGFSSWIVSGSKQTQYNKDSSNKIAVCKINSTYYTNIGKAIEVSKSGDTIEVIPGNIDRNSSAYTITTQNTSKKLTIPQGVTLNIPYEIGKANEKKASGATTIHALGNRTSYCKSCVILGDGLKLINNGVIEIGGIIGAGSGGNPSGCTSGNYSELILGNGSVLENHNTINIYGYLGEKASKQSTLIVKPNISGVRPTISMPMYWYDFSGGSSLKAIYDAIGTKYCMPLDDFYFENIGTKTITYGGSDVFSWVNLYAASSNGQYDLQLIGSNGAGIISLPSGSYLESYYNSETLINDLHFYGNASFNAFTIDVEKAIKDTAGSLAWGLASMAGIPSKVTSNDGYFPVSYHFNIVLDKLSNKSNAFFDGSSSRYKLLNGSNFKIEKNVEFKSKELVAYKGDDIYSTRGALVSNLKKSKMPLTLANINVEGRLYADRVAGQFYGAQEGGTICALNDTKVTMYEPKKGEGDTFSAKMLDGEEGWYYIPLTLTLKNAAGAMEERTAGRYSSFGEDCYWDISKELTSILISEKANNYSSGKRKACTFEIIAEYLPLDNIDIIESFSWKQKRHRSNVSEDGTFENASQTGTIFKTVKNDNIIYDNEIDVWLEVSVKGRNEVIKSNVITFNARKR